MNGRLRLYFPYILFLAIVGAIVVANVPGSNSTPMQPAAMVCGPCGMQIDPSSAISAIMDGTTYYFCGPGCKEAMQHEHVSDSGLADAVAGDNRLIDVVCQMEVNRSWRITAVYQGKTFHFCTKRCSQAFLGNPERFLAEECLVCGNLLGDAQGLPATYMGKTYRLCSESHRAQFKGDPAVFFMHSMWGIPTWLYYASIALVMVLSFGIFEYVGGGGESDQSVKIASARGRKRFTHEEIRGEGERMLQSRTGAAPMSNTATMVLSLPILVAESPPIGVAHRTLDETGREDRFDLLSISLVKIALRSRVFRFTLQAIFVAMFALIVAAGLFGNQNPALNIAPIMTWTIWWGALIILIMFAGKAWCYVCPWDAIAGWTEKLALWKKTEHGLSLGLRWPRVIRNILLATLMFVGLTWIELGFGVTMKPRVTAYLALGMLLMAVVAAMLFDRKSFCRYGCLVGRVSGLYALFSSVEVRAKHKETCEACHTKECVKGSETAYGCPTFLYPGKLETNTYCIQCMECVQACPHDNMAVNLRPWGSDLAIEGKPRADEAYLALLMLAITGFHGLTMTPVWAEFVDAIREGTGAGRVLGFSAGMAVLMLCPIGIYAFLVAVSRWLARGHGPPTQTYRDYFIRYSYALLPIALFYHIAHNLEHLLMEGPKVASMISDPFGWGWNVLGTANWNIPPLISLPMLWMVQVLLVLVGHVYSLWVTRKTSLRLFASRSAAFRSQLPMLVGMIAFSVFSLWLLKQPMEMRTSAM